MDNASVARFLRRMVGLAQPQAIIMEMVAIAAVVSMTPIAACQMPSSLVARETPPAAMKMENAFFYVRLLAMEQSVVMTAAVAVAATVRRVLSALLDNAQRAADRRSPRTGPAIRKIMIPVTGATAIAGL